MSIYRGTDGDDLIEQASLGSGYEYDAYVYGGAGNDHIRLTSGSAEGEAGDDWIEGGPGVSALYWGAPAGIRADLQLGVVHDGYGGIDTLDGIRIVGGSPHDDEIVGSTANEQLIGNGGNDSFAGGGGYDRVSYFGADPQQAQVDYDEATDTFTIVKQFVSGDHGIDVLTGIDAVEFMRPDGTQVTITPRMWGTLPERAWYALDPAAGAFFSYLVAGDFDGDGAEELVITQSVGVGVGAAPLLGFAQDGHGGLREATGEVFAGGQSMPYPGALTPFAADVNGDGTADLVVLNFGQDQPPFDGGFNSLFLGSPDGLVRLDAEALGSVQGTHHGGSVGDLDGDGDPDLLLNSLDGNASYVLEYLGSDEWQVDTSMFAGLSTRTASLIADFDLDGRSDVLLGRWHGMLPGEVSSILWGGAQGYTLEHSVALPDSGVAGATVLSADLVDLDGDDRPDLALNLTNGGTDSYRTPYVQLLRNAGDGTFVDETASRLPQPLAGTTNNYSGLSVADFNQDGRDDLLVAGGGTEPSRLWLARADGTFEEAWASPNSLAQPIDIGWDGVLEVVSLASDGTTLVLHGNEFGQQGVLRLGFGAVHLQGGPAAETLLGRTGDESLAGGGGDDTLRGGAGDDALDGAGGIDTAAFDAALGDLALHRAVEGWVLETDSDGIDTLAGVERVHCNDGWLALDIDAPAAAGGGHAGITASIIGAVFGAAQVADPVYVGIGLSLLDAGMDPQALTGLALLVALGADPAPANVVDRLWTTVMGAPPSPGEAAPFVELLEAGMAPAMLGWLAALTPMNRDQVDLVGLSQTGIEFVLAT